MAEVFAGCSYVPLGWPFDVGVAYVIGGRNAALDCLIILSTSSSETVFASDGRILI